MMIGLVRNIRERTVALKPLATDGRALRVLLPPLHRACLDRRSL